MQKMLAELLDSVDVPAEVRTAVLAALHDPSKLDAALDLLKSIGADEIGSGPPLDIEDFYQDGSGLYELRWPLGVPLPMPFADLDRKTQFYVLFQEWMRRELEAMVLLNRADEAGAEAVFAECLERARQIDVPELMARSYEGFMRVAQRRGDRDAEREWLGKAAAARQKLAGR
jgi:hypothetical protein